MDAQIWFSGLHAKVTARRQHQAAIAIAADSLMPAMLDQIFN